MPHLPKCWMATAEPPKKCSKESSTFESCEPEVITIDPKETSSVTITNGSSEEEQHSECVGSLTCSNTENLSVGYQIQWYIVVATYAVLDSVYVYMHLCIL